MGVFASKVAGQALVGMSVKTWGIAMMKAVESLDPGVIFQVGIPTNLY